MVQYKVGDWHITDEGLHWVGEGEPKYSIEKENLLEIRNIDGKYIYAALIYLTSSACTSKDDLLSLNITFMQAVQHHNLRFDNSVFLSTLSEQLKIISTKYSSR